MRSTRHALLFLSGCLAMGLCLAMILACGGKRHASGGAAGAENQVLTLSPAQVSALPGQTVQMTAALPWGGGIRWSVLPAEGGSITPDGLFTAGGAPGQYTIVAVWDGDVRFTATASASVGAEIQGSLGALGAGATLAYTDGTAKTATADASGAYRFAVPYGWSGTVTPSLAGFVFTPASQTYEGVVADQTQNYTAAAGTPTVTAVTITPGTATLSPGQTQQLQATVAGTGGPAQSVIWSTAAGQISRSGLYTAPPSGAGDVVTATSLQDPTQSGQASVTLTPPTGSVLSVAVSPGATGIPAGQTQQFTAVVTGSQSPSQAVTWAATRGQISSSGLYTAPNSGGGDTVSATSLQDATVLGQTVVTVQAPTGSITAVAVSPSAPLVQAGATAQFTAAVSGTGSPSQAVTWSAAAGQITSSGLYTAPAFGGSDTITATSVQDSTILGQAAVTSNAPTGTVLSVIISPDAATVPAGVTVQLTATVLGTAVPSQAVIWASLYGQITRSGLYTAPPLGCSDTVTATSVQALASAGSAQAKTLLAKPLLAKVLAANPGISGTASLTVTPGTGAISALALSPSQPAVSIGGSLQFAATIHGTGSPSQSVTWSAASGRISGSGLYTAPADGGGDTVTATSVQDPGVSAQAAVTVNAATGTITAVNVSPSAPMVSAGQQMLFTANVTGTGSPNQAVVWSASSGQIDASGLYTAPASGGADTVTAASVQNPSVAGHGALTILGTTGTVTSVIVTPGTPTVSAGQTELFTATVTGTGSPSQGVTFTAARGTITPSGLYTAPALGGSDTITATSAQDPTVSGTATVAVPIAVLAVVVSPASPTVRAGQTQQFTATVNGMGGPGQGVTWQAGLGTINASGLYTAPAAGGADTVTATSALNPSISGMTAVTVVPYTISGTLGSAGAGATISYTGGSVTANASGTYSFTVGFQWSGTVTPALAGYSFSPASLNYVHVQADQTGQNFSAAASTYTISGNAGVAGATLSWTDGTAKTATAGEAGAYSFTVSYNWSGTVTPSLTGYAFTQANTSYSHVQANQAGQNYTATAITFTISGNAGVAGATLSWTDGTAKTATADGTGAYSLTVSYNWSGTVIPSRAGYRFIPAGQGGYRMIPPGITYTHVLANQINQNYTATAITYALSGNAGVAGATLSWTDGTAKTATADGAGAYSITVSYNWSGTVTPSLAGYTFTQPSISYSNVLANQTGQNYTATAVGISITPGWTLPAPPNATVGQSYPASVPAVVGDTYLWTVTTGSATLINATTAVVTFTPTGAGTIGLSCVRTDPITGAATAAYTVSAAAGDVLNAQPASISQGQGTILLATFIGTTGIINPGAIPVTSDVGVTVQPGATTTYTLNVDGTDVATTTVSVLTYTPKFVYVSNSGDGTISGFSIDLVTNPGALTPISGSPFPTPDSNHADQIQASPDGKFLFAAGQSGSVYAYTIDGAGVLASVAGSPFIVPGPPTIRAGARTPAAGSRVADGISTGIRTLAVDPFGRFLYAHGDDSMVYAYTIDPTTGALTPVAGSPYFAGNNVDATNGAYGGVIVHPSGLYLYVAAAGDNTVYGFSIDQTTGALAAVTDSPFDVSDGGLAGPFAVAVDPTGAYFFTKGETGTSWLAGRSINLATGALTKVTGSPFGPLTGNDAWHGLCSHPTLSVLYTAFYGSATADAGAYALDIQTGNLTELSGSPYDLFPVSHGSDSIAVDRSGQFAYSTCYGDTSLMLSNSVISNMTVHGTGTPGSDLGALFTLGGVLVSGANETTTPVGHFPDSIAIAGSLQ